MTGSAGSGTRWGPLFSARAEDWAETWESADGWGTRTYEHVLDRAVIGRGTRVLDCGCGAGRFAAMAANRGALVAGIDAAEGLIRIAARRTPTGDFRVGDLEVLPWPDDRFDIVTGFNAYQFADDKVRALSEAARVSRELVAVVIPTRADAAGLALLFKELFPLFPSAALKSMRHSGIYGLSEPGLLDRVLAEARLTIVDDAEINTPIVFPDADAAHRAFLGAGPTAIAIEHSGLAAVEANLQQALDSFATPSGRLILPAWHRIVLARSAAHEAQRAR